jgi:hypothetical protein
MNAKNLKEIMRRIGISMDKRPSIPIVESVVIKEGTITMTDLDINKTFLTMPVVMKFN